MAVGRDDRSVAVVGVGCRLPGGITDLDGLWEALREGRDLVGEMPPDRFPRDRFVDPGAVRPGRSYTAAGGFLDDIASFDAAYFGISPKEAAHIDPQQRLLLEMAAEALDDAAVPAEVLAGSDTCVYVGVSDPAYGTVLTMSEDHTSPHTMPGATLSIAANRLSYAFDLRGPSMAIDTACSSSLVALDRACRTLREGTSRVALAGGVNVLANPYSYAGFSYAGMLSRRGRCAAFSAEADGFVRAEGGAVLVLKRLADAVADGDRIHAVLAGTGSNSDGRTTGMTLPSSQAQEALLRAVCQEAGIGPDDLVYFEAHGTGTPVGDPAEARAIGQALGTRRGAGPLPVGSVKSNLGHLEPAAGMAGLLKAILVLRHRTAPASLHALPLNPAIDFDALGLAPTVAPVELSRSERAAVGVNSFGFGGANAHAVLVPPPAVPAVPEPEGRPVPVVVSARSPKALRQLSARMADRLRAAAPGEFYDLARTSTLRRSAHPHRAAVLATDPREAADALEALFTDAPSRGAVTRKAERTAVAFVYSGNASQWPGMAAGLMAGEAVFRTAVEEADAALAPHLGWSVAKELERPTAARWARTEIAQPVLFAVQVGLTALLQSQGLRPGAVAGHSVGEVAAAYAAGALTLEQAALVLTARSRTQAATAGRGRMAAVGLPEDAAREELARFGEALEIAGVNSDRDVTVAGDPDALAALGAELTARDVFFRELDLDYAFHSRAMDLIEEPLCAALDGLSPGEARTPFVSTVTSTPLSGAELGARYWWRNVREPVRFADAMDRLADDGIGIVVEIGPHPVLRPYLRRTGLTYVPTLHRDGDGPREATAAVAALLAAGAEADWQAHFPHPGRVADLPAYPWQRDRHWHGTPQDLVVHTSGTGALDHPLLGERLPAPHPLWHGTVEPQLVPWLGDHRIGGSVLMPAAAYVEMALTAGQRALGRPVEVRHLDLHRPFPVDWPDPAGAALQTAVVPADGTLTISARDTRGAEIQPIVRAQVRTRLSTAPGPLDIAAVEARCPRTLTGPDHYEHCHRLGIGFGPAFHVLRGLALGDGELLAWYRLDLPAGAHTVHPVLLDGPLQATAALAEQPTPEAAGFLPSAFGAVRVWRTPASEGVVHLRRRSRSANEICWDITYADPDGTVTAEIDKCRTRRARLTDHAPLTVQRTVLRAAPYPSMPAPPSPLPARAEPAAHVRERIAAARAELEGSGHASFTAAAEQAGAHCWAAALRGLLPDPDEPFTVPGLVGRGLAPRHRRLVRLMLPLLVEQHLAEPDAETWRLRETGVGPEEALRSLVADHPRFGPAALLINSQLRQLPDVLRGTVDPRDLLPVGESFLEQWQETAPAHRFTHRVVQALLDRIVRDWPADRPLRVLEVGATGTALTAAVLPLLPPDRTHYTCTAPSHASFARARHRFAACHFIDYRTLDPDADPAVQGFPAGGFDLVLAGDALHTAADLAAALGHVRSLLAPGGLLLATERHHERLDALLLGGLESLWKRGDHALRPTTRLLPRAAWTPLLERCGFTGVWQTGPEDHTVLLATAPSGVVAGASGGAAVPAAGPAVPAAGPAGPAAGPAGPAAGPAGPAAGPAGPAVGVAGLAAGVAGPADGVAGPVAGVGESLAGVAGPVAGVAGPPDGAAGPPDGAAAPSAGVAAPAAGAAAPMDEAVPSALSAPPEPQPGTAWLVVTETDSEASTARELAALLGPATVLPAPSDADAWQAALTAEAEPRIVLLLAEPGPRQLVARTTRRAAVLRTLAAACRTLPEGRAAQVWLVTRPTGLFPAPERAAHPEDAAVWGTARTLANEEPGLGLRRVSLDRTGDATDDARRLATELLNTVGTPAGAQEDEVVLTPAGRFTPLHLEHPADEPPARPTGTPFLLEVRDPGPARRLVWNETAVPRPGPGEVAVEMRAVALNYRDPMRANGLLPPEAVEGTPLSRGLGIDGAGIVRAVGPGVRDLTVGDRVCGIVPAALASHAVTPDHSLTKIPQGMNYAEAATFPVAFLTIHHALVDQARMAPGETVLVHGGAGAVGLAALQCAHDRGARVIATAGTETKRNLLRSLGAWHVLDSRSLDFVPRVRELTEGRGVDIVVNSLSGEAIGHGLDLLRPNGRFVELGKRDIFLNNTLSMRPFDRSLTFIGFNLDHVVLDRDRGARLMADVVSLIHQGVYRPLPHTVYPAARVEEAFHVLQHSRHIGKVVVSFDSSDPSGSGDHTRPLDEPVPVQPAPPAPALNPDGTYLVTGGLSGFGAATARWLADHGARHLALVSRRGGAAPEAPALLEDLARRGARATAHAADITDEAALRRVIDATDATGHRLCGVVHAAMHLDDAPLADLTDDRFTAVLAPKADGADLLDRLTADRDLDLFLTYSSIATAVGNVGQAPYAAGNAYLEAQARARRAGGRPATALAFGPIGETGYVARHAIGDAMAERGFQPLTVAEALTTAGGLLQQGTDVAGIGRYRWGRARRLLPALATARFTALVPPDAAAGPEGRAQLRRELAALAPDEARAAIIRTLTRLLAAVLHSDPEELDPARPVTDFGLDSLLSTEFLVRAGEHFDIRLAAAELMSSDRTLTHFAHLVHSRLDLT
ncbi:SDR family NAD(P)-dependent oxidoreductase [Streptomyces hawaiiensis]|uniref:SDR family NAD(P)-dependent oxidoreductase n=1 Tax=Streptomyces hawaiiensis TaxID=67305 RepID=UPI003649D972